MVWFQCEDCGDNLKKPKLPSHFRTCSARKLSCIDCGEMFGRDTVQDHQQCISEAEKYGPKGQVKPTSATPKKDKKLENVDVNVGLSQRPPWFCSLCNTTVTSKQTLLLHAEGKKHIAKAKAHAAKQHSVLADKCDADEKLHGDNTPKVDLPDNDLPDNKFVEQPKFEELSKAKTVLSELDTVKGTLTSNRKRKHNALENGSHTNKRKDDILDAEGNGEVIQGQKDEMKETKTQRIVKSTSIGGVEKGIKWKKLIKSALKSQSDGVLKMKKLKKLVLKAIKESGVTEDDTLLGNVLEQKVQSSSKFSLDKKYVRLVDKD